MSFKTFTQSIMTYASVVLAKGQGLWMDRELSIPKKINGSLTISSFHIDAILILKYTHKKNSLLWKWLE